MLRALGPKVLAFTIVLLFMVPLTALAANWQWSRHLEREARNLKVASQSVETFTNIETLSLESSAIHEWKLVTVRGIYDVNGDVLWRRQSLRGAPGFMALATFTTETGTTIVVNRGWVGALGAEPDSTANLSLPSSQTEITVRIRPMPEGESTDPGDIPTGQTNSPRTIRSNDLPGTLFELVSPQVSNGPELLTLPEPESGPHLGYVGQWILIGIASIAVYVVVLRQLKRDYDASLN